GTGHATGGAEGGRASAREGLAGELFRRPAGPCAVADAQGDHSGVRAGRRSRACGAARLLPDSGDLPLHPVPRRRPRRLRKLQPTVRQRALRLPPAGNAGAGLRPHRDLHRADLAQRGYGAGPPLRGHPRHDLGRLGRLLRAHKRPQPRLRRAGDAAVLEGQGHRHPDDRRDLGARPRRRPSPDRRPLHRRDDRRGIHAGRRVHISLGDRAVAGGAVVHGRDGRPALLLRPRRRAAVSLDHAWRLRRYRLLGAREPGFQRVPRQRLQLLQQDLRLHRHGHHPAALPLHLVPNHPLRRHPERHAREDEGGDLRRAHTGRRARQREARHPGRGGNRGDPGRRQI
ncbi:MAG: Inner membrane protein YihY, formerly thought to be RNase BN, partial [uncultured Rubrobacteraceae bacterium]